MAKVKDGFLGERSVHVPKSLIKEQSNDEFCNILNISDIGYYPKAKYHYRKRTNEESTDYLLIYELVHLS